MKLRLVRSAFHSPHVDLVLDHPWHGLRAGDSIGQIYLNEPGGRTINVQRQTIAETIVSAMEEV